MAAVTAALKFTQNAVVGTAGVSYVGNVANGVVTVANNDNTNVNRFVYTLLDVPVASALTVGQKLDTTVPNSTTTFTPDVLGTYKWKLQVYDLAGTTVSTDTHNFVAAVTTQRSWQLPGYGDDGNSNNQQGSTTGWKVQLNTLLRDIVTNGFFRDTSLSATTNQSLIWNGSLWVPGTPTTGPQWTTVLDQDFTTTTAATFATDGNYTISGRTWTKANSASEAASMAIVSNASNGLVIQPSTNKAFGVSTRDAPLIYTSLTGLNAGILPDVPWRLSLYPTACTTVTAGDGISVALWDPSANAYGSTFARFDFGSFTLATVANGETTASGYTFGASTNAWIIESSGAWRQSVIYRVGAYSAGFPAASATRLVVAGAGTTQGIVQATQTDPFSNMRLVIAGTRGGSSAPTLKIGRIKFEALIG